MRIVLFASGEFAVPTIRRLATGRHGVAALVSQPSRPQGRGRQPMPTPAAAVAGELGIPVIECPDVNTVEAVERIRSLGAGLGIVIAFGQKLGPAVLAAMPCGCVNLHASLLPKYRGAAPIAWAILCGEEKTGVTVFRLADRMDAGEILIRRETPIGPDETAGELHDRLAQLGPEAITEAVELFERDPSPRGVVQNDREASIAPRLSKASGLLHFERGAIQLARHIRAMTPWPGARCAFRPGPDGRPEEVALCRARPIVETSFRCGPGRPFGVILDGGHVVTGEGLLDILEIQPAGRRVMSWQDFVNGRHAKPGDRFESLAPL